MILDVAEFYAEAGGGVKMYIAATRPPARTRSPGCSNACPRSIPISCVASRPDASRRPRAISAR